MENVSLAYMDVEPHSCISCKQILLGSSSPDYHCCFSVTSIYCVNNHFVCLPFLSFISFAINKFLWTGFVSFNKCSQHSHSMMHERASCMQLHLQHARHHICTEPRLRSSVAFNSQHYSIYCNGFVQRFPQVLEALCT